MRKKTKRELKKGPTLPKKFWVKGKSKFAFCRLREDKVKKIERGKNIWDYIKVPKLIKDPKK